MLKHEDLFIAYSVVIIIIIICSIYNYLYIESRVCEDKKEKKGYIIKSHGSMVRGIVFGILLDGSIESAVRNGAIYGVVTPLLSYIGLI